MTEAIVKAAVLVWKARPEGGYASVGGRFVIELNRGDWCLTEANKARVRRFGTFRDAKAGAEWVLNRPAAPRGEPTPPCR